MNYYKSNQDKIVDTIMACVTLGLLIVGLAVLYWRGAV